MAGILLVNCFSFSAFKVGVCNHVIGTCVLDVLEDLAAHDCQRWVRIRSQIDGLMQLEKLISLAAFGKRLYIV